uniref:Uncharacterized protein n=1 Tax=Onchocerca volvulus TaxID=6282 RepID=A0A8R1TMQ5_ONCVO
MGSKRKSRSPRFRRRFDTGNRGGVGIKKPPIGSRYITNRITEIKGVKDIMFHHVKTADNPADLASRGVLPKVLKDSSLWWNGPSWLIYPLENWSREEFGEEVQERICIALGLTTCTKLTSAIRTTTVDVKRFSSLQKLIRTILFVMRFMAKVSRGKVKSLEKFSKEGRFTSSDYEQAKKLVVRMEDANQI